ncbi:MAG: type I restriction enzyme HsdR N-terminal domain-containing protein [Sediminibacterium sp.]|nr:type I restriction enzyme HsdR N-terminal domain-containing protein [Sediminibacterium sp.]MDP3127418.1 type I restriction enzyme HsdR N-terminal domain-containing protein [Sediminibacterium sp.]
MIKIDYPAHDFRVKEENGKEWVFDEIRKQWVRLTPEEWVRQNMLQYLVQVKKYPASLIAIEKEITLGELKKRFDILVYKASKPWMMIECKEMNIPLTETVLRQVLNYNISVQADFMIITNGTANYGFAIINGKANPLDQLPNY